MPGIFMMQVKVGSWEREAVTITVCTVTEKVNPLLIVVVVISELKMFQRFFKNSFLFKIKTLVHISEVNFTFHLTQRIRKQVLLGQK